MGFFKKTKNKETAEERVKRKLNTLAILLFLVTSYPMGYCVLWDGLLQEYIQQRQGMDNFCKVNGYNKATSHNTVGARLYVDYIQVECDKKIILNWYMESYCSKIDDKWGKCLDEDFIVNRDVGERKWIK